MAYNISMKKGLKKGEYEDLAGRVYGNIIVTGPTTSFRTLGKDRKRQYRYWSVSCLGCGKDYEILQSNLKRTLAGCASCVLKRITQAAADRNRKWPDSEIGAMYTGYRRNAEKRGVAFDLPYEVFASLVKLPCFYCAAAPRGMRVSGGYKPIANGLDRADNNLGYTKENCVPCCSDCNYEKNNMTRESVYKFFPDLKPPSIGSEAMLYI
jgi:hypothetical protein